MPAHAASVCQSCDGELGDGYYRINGRPVCAPCHRRMLGSASRAVLGGVLAGAASVGVYYAVLSLFDFRFSLVAVLAGVAIGTGVRRGRGYRIKFPFRLLAVLLTYAAVVTTYTHAVLEMPSHFEPWRAWLDSWSLPFRMALEGKNIVSLILLLFGLHEAWQFSAPPVANVEGPVA